MSSHSTMLDRNDMLTCTPVHPHFAARAEGIDLRRPLTEEQKAAVKGAMDRYGVVVFPNQMMSDDEQAAFAEQFGTIEETPTLVDQERRRIANMKINDISNLGPDGRIWGADDRRRMYNLGNLLWHSDSSFKPTPAYWSMLQARVIPPVGGATEYIDTRVAWDHLPDELKAIAKDLIACHSLIYSREQMGFDAFSPEEVERCTPVPQRLVRLHKGIRAACPLPLRPYRRHRGLAPSRSHGADPGTHRIRDPAPVRLCASMGGRGPRHLGQSLHHASRHAL